jgi:hypothetical protein
MLLLALLLTALQEELPATQSHVHHDGNSSAAALTANARAVATVCASAG